jgi:hypothetical protein
LDAPRYVFSGTFVAVPYSSYLTLNEVLINVIQVT